MLGGKPQHIGRLGRVLMTLPQNTCAAFGADHGIISVLEHGDSIPDADTQRAA